MIGGVTMKELIRMIRAKANMNQEQFASALGTTAVSINRWEKSQYSMREYACKRIQIKKSRGIVILLQPKDYVCI